MAKKSKLAAHKKRKTLIPSNSSKLAQNPHTAIPEIQAQNMPKPCQRVNDEEYKDMGNTQKYHTKYWTVQTFWNVTNTNVITAKQKCMSY